jgi:hypothetical protein
MFGIDTVGEALVIGEGYRAGGRIECEFAIGPAAVFPAVVGRSEIVEGEIFEGVAERAGASCWLGLAPADTLVFDLV